jgi:hypothetical protein
MISASIISKTPADDAGVCGVLGQPLKPVCAFESVAQTSAAIPRARLVSVRKHATDLVIPVSGTGQAPEIQQYQNMNRPGSIFNKYGFRIIHRVNQGMSGMTRGEYAGEAESLSRVCTREQKPTGIAGGLHYPINSGL